MFRGLIVSTHRSKPISTPIVLSENIIKLNNAKEVEKHLKKSFQTHIKDTKIQVGFRSNIVSLL